MAGVKAHYAPGEDVGLTLSATNERGEPAPAVLGVAVFDEALASLTIARPPTMATRLLLTDEIAQPADLKDADFYLSDKVKNKVPAAVALDLLLGTQAEAELALEPPAMFDNIRHIRADYEKNLADYQAGRTAAMNTLTTASFFGGLGLVLLVAMLGLMRIVSGMHLWIAAIGATTCCLIVGAILMDPGLSAADQGVAVGFSSYSEPIPKSAAAQNDRSVRVKSDGRLRVTIKRLPEQPSLPRRVPDAIGSSPRSGIRC